MSSRAPARRPEQRLLAHLQSTLERAGWTLVRPAGDGGQPDLVLARDRRVLGVELKASSGRARRAVLRGLLADAVLQSRVSAKVIDGEPLPIVAAPAISNEIAEELAEYMHRVAPGMAWGLMDERGRIDLHGEGFEDVRPEELPDLPLSPPPRPPQPHNPFSDLGQWMLKVLLASRVPEPWLNAPRSRIGGVADLAAAARVSPASASRFLAALESEGYLVRAAGRIRLVRIDSLLEAWRQSHQGPSQRLHARFLLPGKDPLRRLRNLLERRAPSPNESERGSKPARDSAASHSGDPVSGPDGERACLGFFAACSSLGLGFVRGAPIHLLSESLSPEFLEQEFELLPVEHPAESELIVVRPRFPESVFRGSVLSDGTPAADALQCWLDVSSHPARGQEQADEIAARLEFEEWSR